MVTQHSWPNWPIAASDQNEQEASQELAGFWVFVGATGNSSVRDSRRADVPHMRLSFALSLALCTSIYKLSLRVCACSMAAIGLVKVPKMGSAVECRFNVVFLVKRQALQGDCCAMIGSCMSSHSFDSMVGCHDRPPKS